MDTHPSVPNGLGWGRRSERVGSIFLEGFIEESYWRYASIGGRRGEYYEGEKEETEMGVNYLPLRARMRRGGWRVYVEMTRRK